MRGLAGTACLLGALAVCAPPLARAQAQPEGPPRDPAAAEALFTEGKRLMDEKRIAEACPKFAESYRLDPGVGALLNLAACEEQRGQIASAWGHYREAVDFLRREKDERRAAFAEQRATALEPRLPRVVITAAAAPAGLVLQRDGVPLSEASLGTELPVDPGEHEVVAEAPGHLPQRATFVAREREVARVELAPLEVAPAPPPAPAPDATRPPTDEAGGARGDTQRLVGFILGGTGLATLAVGGVFVGLTASNKAQADEGCPTPTTCSPQGFSDVGVAKDTAMVANVTLIGGAVLTAAGVVLVLTAPSRSDGSASWIAPTLGPERAGLSAHARF